MTPRPPKHVGLQTLVQATLHFPPETVSELVQIMARRRLSIWDIAHSDRQQGMLMCTGIADRVTFVRSVRPACVRMPDFQVGTLEEMESTNSCSSALLSLMSDRGMPRYLHGNGASTQGKTCWTSATISSVHRMGVATHLSTLVIRPDAPAKSCRI